MKSMNRIVILWCALALFGACRPEGTPATDDDADSAKWCVEVECGDHGTCQPQESEGVCVCNKGYAGLFCDACESGYQDNDGDGVCAPGCDSDTSCGARGTCDDTLGVILCACETGYEGRLCDTCVVGYQDNDGDGVCAPDCATQGSLCGTQGTCQDTSGEAICVCDPGFEGEFCDGCGAGSQDRDGDGVCAPTCMTSGLDCGVIGRCDDSSGLAACVCNQGYAGQGCDECAVGYQDNDGDGVCAPDCATRALTCNDHGTCDDSLGVARCACDAAYSGGMCEACAVGYQDNNGVCEPECDAVTDCAGHGECAPAGSPTLCVCEPAYAGEGCDECAAGYQDNDGDGECSESCALTRCQMDDVCEDGSGQASCLYDGPTSCADVLTRAGMATMPDGYYTVYADRQELQPWDVWCEDMSSGTPRDYLTIAYTDDENSRFESYGIDGLIAQTRYYRVRIDPDTLVVDVTDRTFSETIDYVEIVTGQEDVDFATARSCSRNNVDPGSYYAASSRLDLRGTPFAVNDSFASYGACPVTSVSGSSQVFDLLADGACGGIAPDDLAAFQGLICPQTMMSMPPDASSPSDFALQLAYSGGYVSMASVPGSCQEIKDFGFGQADGDYTLYYGRQSSSPWTVHCVDMMTSEPKEYVTLPEQSNGSNVFKHGTFAGSPITNTTRQYQRVRIDPLNLRIDITDRRFSTGTADLDFATANSCSANCCGGNNPGVGKLDFRGTPFFVDDEFGRSGFCSTFSSTFSISDQIVEITGDGQCGGVGPVMRENRENDGCNPKPSSEVRYNNADGYLLQLGYL